ncbi:SMI1/KNR4 family protein [Actinomadura xylanilytica]|uniref:SMI1/KNR4 family protein n=1 Tax=Actinomadura xylanilytica TaxID=887459 RepID=UPI00255A822D|nr:SMI1/KNR4 family protein [Actinomadura xylanilytica]MDL4776845.1 SMI1/KNR4 family protein [Actinomadura xylanilytica]
MADDQNVEAEALFQKMALSLAKGAPQGYRRASLSARTDRHGMEDGVVTNVLANGRSRPGPQSFRKQLSRIHDLDGAGTETLSIELAVYPTGRFEALTSRAISPSRHSGAGTGGHVYALDPDVPPPDIGDDQPGPLDAAQAGDPGEAVRLLRRHLEKRAEIFERPADLAEPLPEPLESTAIEDLAHTLGLDLPDDLRALYTVADGDGGAGLMDRHPWFGFRRLVDFCLGDRWWAARDTWCDHRVRDETSPPGVVRRSADRPGWIPFAESTGGDFLAVDMDPAQAGRPGQVIRIGRNHDAGAVFVADSVTTLLRLQLEALERGAYTCDAENAELWIDAELPARRGPSGPGTVRETGPRRDEVQVLSLTGETDLASLAGHPTLRMLTVKASGPVSLAPLRDCPRLYGLDLSQAWVRDIEAVSEMAGLLYLSLRHDQWTDLFERTDRLPALAAPALAGAPTPGMLAEWASRFGPGGDGDGFRYHTGQLTV